MKSYVLENNYYPSLDILQISQFLGMLGFEKLKALGQVDSNSDYYKYDSRKFQLDTNKVAGELKNISRDNPRVCPGVLLDSSKRSALSIQIDFMKEVFKKFQLYQIFEKRFEDDKLVIGIQEKFQNLKKIPWYKKLRIKK